MYTDNSSVNQKNLEVIQDQITICAKREIKVQKRNKSLKKEIKVQIEKGNKSPNRKGEIKVQIKYGKKVCDLTKKVIPKITM
jgi:hypothetical protein